MKSNLKSYYNNFIKECRNKLLEYKNNLKITNDEIEKIKYNIDNIIIKIKDIFNLKADKIYCDDNLKKNLLKYLEIAIEEDKPYIIQYLKYNELIKNKLKYERLIKIKEQEINLNFNSYREYVNRYYMEVHKQILNGFSYKFNGNIGQMLIIRCKNRNKTKIINYRETNKTKELFKKENKKIYPIAIINKMIKEGKDVSDINYIKYKYEEYFYVLKFIPSSDLKGEIIFKQNRYTNPKYRGYSHQELVEKYIDKEDDIYNMQIDLRSKISLMSIFNPNIYTKFITSL